MPSLRNHKPKQEAMFGVSEHRFFYFLPLFRNRLHVGGAFTFSIELSVISERRTSLALWVAV